MANQKIKQPDFQKIDLIIIIFIIAFYIAFLINLILGIILAIIGIALIAFFFNKKNAKTLASYFLNYLIESKLENGLIKNDQLILEDQISTKLISTKLTPSREILTVLPKEAKRRLEKRKKYLHIALNSTLEETKEIILQLPNSDRILIEVGTPLIKIYGTEAISQIKTIVPAGTYIVADNKCADLARREVEMMANAGANAATCLGVAPIETIDRFIEECQKFNIDSMVDMMNVENPLAVLKRLKKLPDVVILHRGVDETEFSKEKQIPYYQIKQIKGAYDILVAVAGGDTIREV
ncbi:MAG: orotidine 5'-phosphate decarboxylase / HUMPS family protein, partial [Minisyncoccia bacterium]